LPNEIELLFFKTFQLIPFREMVFKCPHCCMVLYANQKHPPRYLLNHVNKFHTDPEINDFTIGENDPEAFRYKFLFLNFVLSCWATLDFSQFLIACYVKTSLRCEFSYLLLCKRQTKRDLWWSETVVKDQKMRFI
jgi:hypothetical protein